MKKLIIFFIFIYSTTVLSQLSVNPTVVGGEFSLTGKVKGHCEYTDTDPVTGASTSWSVPFYPDVGTLRRIVAGGSDDDNIEVHNTSTGSPSSFKYARRFNVGDEYPWTHTLSLSVGPEDCPSENAGFIDFSFGDYSCVYETPDDTERFENVVKSLEIALSFPESTVPLYLGDTELLTVSVPNSNSTLGLIYTVGNGPDITISNPDPDNKNIIKILGKDFLSPADFGKTIRVWANIGCTPSGFTRNPLVFTYLKAAPHITSIATQGTTCFDSDDGSVAIKFDRPLATDGTEKMDIRIEDLSEQDGTNPDGTLRFKRVGGQEDVVLDTNNSITIEGLPKSSTDGFKIVLRVIDPDTNIAYNTGGANYTGTIHIDYNPPVAFEEKPQNIKKDIWCFGGSDGEIIIKATGGTGANYEYVLRVKGNTTEDWVAFDDATSNIQTITGLTPNTYEIKIRDDNNCIAKIQTIVDGVLKLGDELIEEVEISTPQEELILTYTGFKEPTSFGLQDGFIVAKITGGTIKDDNSYNYIWKDENGNVLPTIDTEYTNGAYFLTLHTIGAGTYSLTVTDKNHTAATDKEGCTIIASELTLNQPKPLSVTIEILEEILCNSTNEYNSERDDNDDGIPNEAQNGALVAHVEGGIQLDALDNNGLPYYYTWKKKDIDGNWIVLSETDSIIRSLHVGDYALNIKDKNDIVLGDYDVDNLLVKEIDSTFYLPEPPQLQIEFTANEIACSSGTNGEIKATVTGGKPPYTYLWSTGDTTEGVKGLSGGTYFITVTDANNCQIQGNVIIKQPGGIEMEIISKIDPICSNTNDGKIEVRITGGTSPYTYLWNTGATTATLQNLVAGKYELTVTDANDCIAVFEEELESATPLVVDLGEDRTLCGSQEISIDATNDDGITYQWTSTNGFTSTSPVVQLTNEGTYTVTVTSSKGCIATDEIVISTKDLAIDASFLLSSQAYAGFSIELANVSNPRGESTEWIVPEEAVVVEKNEEHLMVKFSEPGEYEVTMLSYVDDCYKKITKNILVEENANLPDIGDANNPFIVEFKAYPNPTKGVFDVKIVLAEESDISLRLVNILTNDMVLKKLENGNNEYQINYDVDLAAGVYFIVLETSKGTETRKVIIQ